jgi:hypothetical protein
VHSYILAVVLDTSRLYRIYGATARVENGETDFVCWKPSFGEIRRRIDSLQRSF